MRDLFLLFVLACVAGGCGYATYERRMDETRRYFTYLDILNQHLSRSVWRGDGVELRAPKQFQLIAPPPAPPASKEDEQEAPQRDPRQPTFTEAVLPGMRGSWKADLTATGGKATLKAYMYVLSNYDLVGKKESEEQAANFNVDVAKTLAKAADQPDTAIEKTTIYDVPKGSKDDVFVHKTSYKMVTPPVPLKIEDDDYRIQIYEHFKDKSPAQVTVVFVLPNNVSPSEKIDRAVDLCLETLNVTQEKAPTMSAPGAPGKVPTKAPGF
jgi:hypothetical protein